MDPTRTLTSLNRRLTAFFHGNPGPLLDAAALAECDAVIRSLQHAGTADPLACSVTGSVIWYQHEHDPKRTGDARFATAVSMLTLVAADDPGAVPTTFLNQLLESEAADADAVVRRLIAVAMYLMDREVPAAKQYAEHRFALAYDLLPDAHPDKAAVGRLVARANGLLYDDTGDQASLDKAIEIAHEALRSALDTDLRLDIAYRLSIDLRKRFRKAGDQADLDLSQRLCAQLIRAVPDDDPRCADYMASYAQTLHQRASLRKSRPELDRVIRLSRKAVELTDPGHEFYLHRLDGLAGALAERAALGDDPPTPEVVDMFRQVRHRAAPDTDVYLSATHNLAAALVIAHRCEPDPAKLREAMALSEETMRLTPAAAQDRWSAVITQSALLIELAADDADHQYLDRAIAMTEQVLETVAGHPVKRIEVMDTLARHLYHRWLLDPARSGELRRALDLWRAIGRERETAPQKRAHILSNAVRLIRHASDPTATLPVFLDLIDSIRMQMWDEHDHQTQMDVLGSHALAAAAEGAACAVELDEAEAAVQILESGRALTWNRSWDLRDELEKIPHTAPGLKAKLQSELMIADMAVSGDTPSTVVGQMKNQAGASIAQLIHQVRALAPSPTLPDPRNFYFLPDRSDLASATAGGPVVYVNHTPSRCDAFIVHDGDIVPFAFPFTSDEFIDVAIDFAKAERGDRFDRDLTANLLLEWLWDNGFGDLIALLRRRGCITGQRDRVWWCPTGLFSFLPLHAIGRTGGTDGVADHLVSSYTSSLKSLRRLRTPPWKFTKTKDTLAVTIKDTPGCPQCYSWPPLETAERERRFLLDTFGRERITDLHGPEATRANMLDALRHHRRFHFSGHGVQAHIAHHSGMIPYDWEQTKKQVSVTDIAQLPNFGGDLAFLGACYASSPPLGEEPVALAQAFHHFGWQHVIAPMMSVYEDSAATLAEAFYRNLITHGDNPAASAFALHDAMLALRAQRPTSPTHWGLFMHLGT
jgi:hypothetical protein